MKLVGVLKLPFPNVRIRLIAKVSDFLMLDCGQLAKVLGEFNCVIPNATQVNRAIGVQLGSIDYTLRCTAVCTSNNIENL